NYRGAAPRLERRRVLVERIRDLATEPLDPLTTEIDPLLDRGRLLVIGQDLDKKAERSFYVHAMRPVLEPPKPWLVILDGEPGRMVYEADDAEEAASWAGAFNDRMGRQMARPVERATPERGQ